MKCLKYSRGMIVLGAIMIAAVVSPSTWTQRAGIDFWNVPKLRAEIAECERQSLEMDAVSEVLSYRIQAKDLLVKELIAGRASLAAVSEEFQSLHSDDPGMIAGLKRIYHVQDERALAALNVLDFTESYLDTDENAAKKPLVMQRLDAEFEIMFTARDIAID